MKTVSPSKIAYTIGKVLLLGVILYFAYKGITAPQMFTKMIPAWVPTIIPTNSLIVIHAIVMAIAALLVLCNKGGKWAYFLLLVTMLGVLLSVRSMILYRDLAIFGGLLILGNTHFENRSA